MSSATASYKSFINPVKFWERTSSKVAPTQEHREGEEGREVKEAALKIQPQQISSGGGLLSSFSFGRKAVTPSSPTAQSYLEKTDINVALKETAKGEVYKLSTIDNSGIYMPPSPSLQGKRDHWVDVNEDIMDFHLPSSECLTTTYAEDDNKRVLYTPSSFVHTQPYILPIGNMSDSALSVPSLDDNDSGLASLSSSRSSESY